MRKRVFVAAGYNTTYFGSGRNEFKPGGKMPTFEEYLKETAEGTASQVQNLDPDEGVIGSFMASRFLKQANIPGFLPYMVPQLLGKPCTGVEGACGTGGRTIATAVKGVLSDLSEISFVTAFEVQNTMKAVYGADVLAGASYYNGERKRGHAYFFPGIFSDRAGAYYAKYGYEQTRRAMAKWYEQSISNARKNPKAQEYHNTSPNLFELGMTPPNPGRFVPHLNHCDCSKVSDGASSLLILSEEGLDRCGLSMDDSVEIIGMGAAEGDITQPPEDLTVLSTTAMAVKKALDQAGITKDEISLLELHDCFSITALLALEAIGYAKPGEAPAFILSGATAPDGPLPTNLSGGLGGFGHPTGASGVRQMVDLLHQFTGKADNPCHPKTPYGLMISMGGNDKTVTAFITKKP